MNEADRNSLIAFAISILIGVLLAFAGSQGGSSFAGIPLFALSVGLAFLIQWLAFLPAYFLQTERFFDLTGSLTYILVIGLSFLGSVGGDLRSTLLSILVVIWAVRLGAFLFNRVQKVGKDGRFDEIKPSFIRFLSVWTIQGLWVSFTVAAALVAITSTNRKELDAFAIVGLAIWLCGFVIEVIADSQKSQFSAAPENRGRFIQTGLWSHSRHPNYFGEIMLWVGVTVITMPVLQGWKWIAVLSPLFVTLLLTRGSGVPLLEKRADEKWGGQEDYEAYKKDTPVLIPKL